MKKIRIIPLLYFSVALADTNPTAHPPLLGGDGTQPYCGTVSPASHQNCCYDLMRKTLNDENFRIHKKNKATCKKSFLKIARKLFIKKEHTNKKEI